MKVNTKTSYLFWILLEKGCSSYVLHTTHYFCSILLTQKWHFNSRILFYHLYIWKVLPFEFLVDCAESFCILCITGTVFHFFLCISHHKRGNGEISLYSSRSAKKIHETHLLLTFFSFYIFNLLANPFQDSNLYENLEQSNSSEKKLLLCLTIPLKILEISFPLLNLKV